MLFMFIFMILALCTLCFFVGKHVEGLRWSERAYLNGSRIYFMGKYYKVRLLPTKPEDMDS